MKHLSMTLSSAHVTLVNERGTVTASVHNASSTAERVVLGVFPTGGDANPPAPQATVPEPQRTLAAGVTEQYEVDFTATGAAAGTHVFKLIPYSADDAPEDYAELGRTVEVVVADKPPPPPAPRRWWILLLAAVLLIAAVTTVVILTRGSTPVPTPTPTPSPSVTLELTGISPVSGTYNQITVVHLQGRFSEPTTVVDLNFGSEFTATRVSDTDYTIVMPATAQPRTLTLSVESAGQQLGTVTFEYTAPVVVTPTFIGLRVAEAQSLAAANGLALQVTGGVFSDTVADQDPPAGQPVQAGSIVRVRLF